MEQKNRAKQFAIDNYLKDLQMTDEDSMDDDATTLDGIASEDDFLYDEIYNPPPLEAN